MEPTAVDFRPQHPLSNGYSADEHTPPLPATPGTGPNSRQSSLMLNGVGQQYGTGLPFSPNYSNLLASAFGQNYESFDLDGMKRVLDSSALPVNPGNGVIPHIDSMSSFDNSLGKKPRFAPSFQSPAGGPTAVRTFTPGALYQHNPNIMATAMNGTPLNLGGPLSGGMNGMQTPLQAGRPGFNAMNLPPSPFMNMMNMNLNGFGMSSPGGYNLGYPTSPIMSPSMNQHTMTGNYGPAAAAAAAAAAGNMTGRTVYVGNLPAEASVDELLNLVRFGPIDNVRLLPEKSCVFISFLDGSTAAAFHADASVKKLALHGQELRIGWGKASSLPTSIAHAVRENQATRNVFVGNLAPTTNEQDLRNDLSKFGPIDQVKIVRDKNIGFIHFLGINAAMKVVQQLPNEPGWGDKRIGYGKDRCAYVPKAQQAAVQAAQAQAAAAISSQHAQMPGSPYMAFSPMTPSFGGFASPTSGFGSPLFAGNSLPVYHDSMNQQAGNRNVYIGNLHPDTTTEDLCNNIRGGQIQQIKYMEDKHIAFVTFTDPAAAQSFYQHANMTNLTLNSRRLKIGWGKHSGPMHAPTAHAVQSGATRNVYLGAVTDFEKFNEEKLRNDFVQYGDIEMINFLTEKGAAFVNFTSIMAAVKAIGGTKDLPDYAELRISFGKDRCANMPRTGTASSTPKGKARPLSDREGASQSPPQSHVMEDSSGSESSVNPAPTPAELKTAKGEDVEVDGEIEEGEEVEAPSE